MILKRQRVVFLYPEVPELAERLTRHYVLEHPASLSGPVPGLPGQGQVTRRPRRPGQLQGDPLGILSSCQVDLA